MTLSDSAPRYGPSLEAPSPGRRRLIRTASRSAEAEVRDIGHAALLAHLRTGALLLAGNGLIVHANSGAKALLLEADGLATLRGRLHAARPGDEQALQRSIAAAANGSGGTVAVTRPSGRASLAVIVQPTRVGPLLASDAWSLSSLSAALVFVVEPDRSSFAPAVSETLRTVYGLTATEAAVANAIAQGQGTGEAAKTLGIATSTLRWHLQRVFEKTGTSRQAGLARLVERLDGIGVGRGSGSADQEGPTRARLASA